jgi:uncharacterized protein YdeI (YjbR/CyaY-like superfamily)
MEFTALVEKLDSEVWFYHIVVPQKIVDHFLKDGPQRLVCTLNGKESFQCAIMAANGKRFINVNKKIRDKLSLVIGEPVTASLAKDTSEYGLPMPDEFREMLNQDPLGDDLFHALTLGKQRNLLYIAGGVKSIDKRIARAIVIVEHLKIHKGKLDFKALNEEMKASRNR